jgi:hypothetical protein
MDFSESSTIKTMVQWNGDTILFADFNHIYLYHPDSKPKRLTQFELNNVYRYESLLIDQNRQIWTGRQRDGIYIFDIKKGLRKHLNQASNPALVYQDYIVDMFESLDGKIWISTEQGWTVYDPVSQTTNNFHSIDLAKKYNQKSRVINCIRQTKDGVFWIGDYDNGLIQWDAENELILNNFTTKSGFRNNEVNSFILDESDNLWIIIKENLVYFDTKSFEIRNFGKEYGLEKQMYCLTLAKDGFLYAGHSNGYYKINMNGLRSTSIKIPKPIITNFYVFDKKQEDFHNGISSIKLPHDQNFISFEFGSLNFFDSWNENYEFRLVNLDEQWISAKGKKRKGYTDLNPGEYRFEVRAKTDGKWSEPAYVTIVINAAWHELWWIRLVAFLFVVMGIYWRINKFLENQKRKIEAHNRLMKLETMVLKSKMNPHFIFNSLNSIRFLFMNDDKKNGNRYITKFAKLLRSTLNYGDENLIQLVEEIKLTEIYVSLEQMRFEDQFIFEQEYSSNLAWQNLLIPPFVVQPIVENAFLHGLSPSDLEQKILMISIVENIDNWSIIIEDNGVGRAYHQSHKSVEGMHKSIGLKMIKERFDLINKINDTKLMILVEDAVKFPTGTRVTINLNKK